MGDLIQRARDIAAGAKLAAMLVADAKYPEGRDPDHRTRYIGFMREGHYDADHIVQATLAALREGMSLAGSAAA